MNSTELSNLPPAEHRTIVVADIAGSEHRHRSNPDRVRMRTVLYRSLEDAFLAADIPWANCYHEDRGDGVFILAPPEIPKSRFADLFPLALTRTLIQHNEGGSDPIRLRVALHAGEVTFDAHGAAAAAITLAFRLADSRPLRSTLAASPVPVALIASSWFFEEVIRHSTLTNPHTYRPARITAKETRTRAWITVPTPLPAVAERA